MYSYHPYTIGTYKTGPTVGALDLGPILAGAIQDSQNISMNARPGGQLNAITQGLGALDSFVRDVTTKRTTVEARTTKDWDRVRSGLQVAKAVPVPIISGIAAGVDVLVQVIYQLFGDKPCDFAKKGPCGATVDADGLRHGGGTCCNPFPQGSGRGIIVTQDAAGYKRFPGAFAEIPAGDYYNIQGTNVPRQNMILKPPSANQIRRDMYKIAPNMFKDNDISSMLVPDGWQVQIFSQPGFQGESKVFGPGFYKLADMGWNDKISSMRVRGPWSIHDHLYSIEFKNKTAGWITERARKPVSPDMILALTGLDPLRPKQPGYQPYDSVWRPGWYLRLSEANALDSPTIKMVFDELGFTPEDLNREKLISMEKTLDTVQLLIQTIGLNNPAQASELLQSAFTMEQLEIASLLSRYGLNQATLQKLQKGLMDAIANMKKQLGVSPTQRAWSKPRFDITQVAFAAD